MNRPINYSRIAAFLLCKHAQAVMRHDRAAQSRINQKLTRLHSAAVNNRPS